jgi:hypothetical protein
VERAGCRGRLVEDEVMFRGAVEEDNWQACHCRDLVSGMEKGNDVYLVYARYAVDMGVVDERYLGRDMQGVRVSYALRGLAFIHARVRVGVTYPLLFFGHISTQHLLGRTNMSSMTSTCIILLHGKCGHLHTPPSSANR